MNLQIDIELREGQLLVTASGNFDFDPAFAQIAKRVRAAVVPNLPGLQVVSALRTANPSTLRRRD